MSIPRDIRYKWLAKLIDILGHDLMDKALAIEKSVYIYSKQCFSSGKYDEIDGFIESIYNDKIASIVKNLQLSSSVQNTYLLQMVLLGRIDLTRIANMSPQELFPGRWIDAINRIKDIELKGNDIEKSTKYKCKKCGCRTSEKYQMQTRSADEPMTTFVTCDGCMNRFQF